jgi:hypothetical protein
VRLSAVLALLVVNLVLAVAVFMSIYLAAGWGEMAGIPAGGDKSGLGGLFAMLILMGVRWSAVAVLLLVGVWSGAFGFLAQGRWAQLGIVLGAHAALGLVSYFGFNAVAEGLTADNLGPQRWSALFGVVLPLPAVLAAGWGANRELLARHPRTGVLLAVAITFGHLMIYRQRYQSMRHPLQAGASIEHSSAPS